MLLKAEQIELAILTAIINWHEESGWIGHRYDIETSVRLSGVAASTPEVLEEVMLLHQHNLIGIHRYISGEWIPYDPLQGSVYFYDGAFRCKCLPGARRRQQELSKSKRDGIFISHFGPESPIAVHLKNFLKATLTPPPTVFVSSDYDSIPDGQWFPAIINGLRQSDFIICLLSPRAIDRRWINFEGGFGFGSEADVLPLVWGGLDKGDVGNPLGQLQVRALDDANDIKAMMEVLAAKCRNFFNASSLNDFMSALPAIEAKVPSTELAVRIFRTKDGIVQLSIQNRGTRQLDMLEVELMMPQHLNTGSSNWFTAWEPVRPTRYRTSDGVRYIGQALTIHPSSQLHLGINPLTPVLTPKMGECVISGIGLRLPAEMSPGDQTLLVSYSALSKQVSIGPEFVPISQIPLSDG